ncbi:putative methionine transporter, NhaC family (TC 2.A.35.1.-) [Cetobacterium ceti]|uniref:Putative methionine transporter, NhaC family (TC 2.A.35.1.-) n=1 Tax=Cetobacterium ceti TaxID=180163 RepID=A0A1T4NPV8_9FUSO|nr:Na+/H+ antiporter NhaC family protein [Cetobacterium ceti]SJZ81232.1 putative methionine transporter, NhaC family (TC 2.A.35.1.-) [Cetobacterium ceti]
MILFIFIYLGNGIITKDLKSMPVEIAFLISAFIAFFTNKKIKFSKKVDTFCKGGGNPNIVLMILIFILAGAFSQISKDMGAVMSVVNFGLSLFPSKVLVPALFIISCFLSLSIGTSIGTIVALTPIALGLADKSGNPLGLCCAAVLGGAMFGDNLSIISDTTIVATRSQGCQMKDKFKVNLKLVLVPAIISTILFYIFSRPNLSLIGNEIYEYNILKMVPYILVLVTALKGIDVFIVLFLGIFSSSCIGLLTKNFTLTQLIQSASKGVQGTGKIVIIVIIVGGIIELVKVNGGIEYIIANVKQRIKKKRDAELWIGMLVLVIDICIGNNTIAVVSAGPIAKEISDEYELEPKIVASILDTFAAGAQGLLPYSNPMLAILGIATSISAFDIIKYNYYNILMIFIVFLAIFIRNFKDLKKLELQRVD